MTLVGESSGGRRSLLYEEFWRRALKSLLGSEAAEQWEWELIQNITISVNIEYTMAGSTLPLTIFI